MQRTALLYCPPRIGWTARTLSWNVKSCRGAALYRLTGVTPRSVRSQLEALRDEKRNPPAAPDEDDWALLSLISDGNLDSAGVAANLGISLSELSSRLTEANRKFEYSIRQMRSWNADRAALTAIRDQETENLRSRKQVDSQS